MFGRFALAGVAIALAMPSNAGMLTEAIDSGAPAIPEVVAHGDWLLSCSSGEDGVRHCQLQPSQTSPAVALTIVLSGPDRPVLVMRAPLEILLPEGIALAVDGASVGRLAFQTCDVRGCVAPAELRGELFSRFRRGLSLAATVRGLDGAGTTATYSLIGITAALNALAASPE